VDIAPGRSYGGAVTTPSDPQRQGQQPDPGRSGPGGYGDQPPYPGQYGGQQAPGQPYPGQQYGQQYGQQPYPEQQGQYGAPAGGGYPYNPYASQYPAGLDDAGPSPAPRPGIMVLSLVLLILSALPFLVGGVLLLLLQLDADTFPPEFGVDEALADAQLTFDTFLSAIRVVGAIMLVLALLYVTFAVLAFVGRNWARIVLTVMSVLFTLLLLLAVVGGASDPVSLIFTLLVLGAVVAGTVLLYLRASNQFFANPRRR
jgi:hypothetical protein